MLKKILFLSVFLVVFKSYNQEVKGKVLDEETQKPIEFVTVSDADHQHHTTTDADGVFYLKFDRIGSFTLYCKHLGYVTEVKTIKITDKIVEVVFYLNPAPEVLDEVFLKAPSVPTKRAGDLLYTGIKITPKGLEMLGASGSNSIFGNLSLIPAVSYQSSDAYGLSDKVIRIRGVHYMFSGVTMEGIPNYGIMPIGARDDIFDQENIKSITLYKGAAPADVWAATGNRGGTIDLNYRRPESEMGFDATQTLGDENYKRTFLRFDSGNLYQKLAVFGSYSYSYADKWKGSGILGDRNHYTTGLNYRWNDHFKLEVLGNWNEMDKHQFKALNYTQVETLEDYYTFDYNENLTGIPASDSNYYDYNQGSFKNFQSLASLYYTHNDSNEAFVKFYYNSENTLYSNTIQSGSQYLVQDKTRDLNQWGWIADWKGSFQKWKYGIGLWMESFDNRVYVYNHTITASGLIPKGYAFYTVPEGRGMIYSPFLKLAYTFKRFNVQMGIKYLHFNEPESERYLALNADALKPNPESDLHSDAIEQSTLLPSLGIGYTFNENLECYANYGRSYMRPYMYVPIISLYLQNRAAFTSQGMTLQSIFDSWKMETADNIDLGIYWKMKKYALQANVFYSKQNNVLTTVLNPVVNVNYGQNVGTMSSYGFEMDTHVSLNQYIQVFVNPSYSKLSFDENIEIKNGSSTSILEIAGNQSPATPVWMLKMGALMEYKGLNINTFLSYTGERFGDATHLETIPEYWMWDANIAYQLTFNGAFKGLRFGVEMKNILDSQYVGIIDVFDDTQNGKASYYTGFPRTFMVQLKMDF